MNKKTNGLLIAKKKFIEDLHNDEDFLKFKNKAFNQKNNTNYGVINSVENRFELNKVGPPCETLISQYQKQISFH